MNDNTLKLLVILIDLYSETYNKEYGHTAWIEKLIAQIILSEIQRKD